MDVNPYASPETACRRTARSADNRFEGTTLTFDLTLEDLVAFAVYRDELDHAMSRGLVRSLLCVGLVCSLALLSQFAVERNFPYATLSLATACALWLELSWRPRQQQQSCRKLVLEQHQRQPGPMGLGRWKVDLNADGWTTDCPLGRFRFPWTRLLRLHLTHDHIFLETANGPPQILPRRVFVDKWELARLGAAIQGFCSKTVG